MKVNYIYKNDFTVASILGRPSNVVWDAVKIVSKPPNNLYRYWTPAYKPSNVSSGANTHVRTSRSRTYQQQFQIYDSKDNSSCIIN